ncbi:hypothetical protein CF134_21725 [Aeromonas salmonicida]|nr:hypothetical protein CF134_21725 [Aeromonas salmonicida]
MSLYNDLYVFVSLTLALCFSFCAKRSRRLWLLSCLQLLMAFPSIYALFSAKYMPSFWALFTLSQSIYQWVTLMVIIVGSLVLLKRGPHVQ